VWSGGGWCPGRGMWGVLPQAVGAWGWGGRAAGRVLPGRFPCAGGDGGGTPGELCSYRWWVPPRWRSCRFGASGGTVGGGSSCAQQGPDGVLRGPKCRGARWGWQAMHPPARDGCDTPGSQGSRGVRRGLSGGRAGGWEAVASPGQPGGWQGPGDVKQKGWQEVPALAWGWGRLGQLQGEKKR